MVILVQFPRRARRPQALRRQWVVICSPIGTSAALGETQRAAARGGWPGLETPAYIREVSERGAWAEAGEGFRRGEQDSSPHNCPKDIGLLSSGCHSRPLYQG